MPEEKQNGVTAAVTAEHSPAVAKKRVTILDEKKDEAADSDGSGAVLAAKVKIDLKRNRIKDAGHAEDRPVAQTAHKVSHIKIRERIRLAL